MKVLVICIFPPVRFPEADHAFQIVQHLADAGVTVDVLTSQGSVETDHPRITQFSVMKSWEWNETARMARQIKRSKPDAILLYFLNHLYYSHPMITFAPTIARALFPSVPFVTLFSHFYGSLPHLFGVHEKVIHRVVRTCLGKKVDYTLGTMLRDSSQIVALSRLHLQELIKVLPQVAEKSTLIPPPPIITLSPDMEESRAAGRKQLGVSDDLFLFAYFGYIYPGKGIDTLLRAFSRVASQSDSIRLAIIGSVAQYLGGPEYAEKVRQLVVDLRLEDKVIFTGAFDWDSPQGSLYLRAADACVLPFDPGVQMNNSSFATAVTHGLPMITTTGPELEEPFVEGENVCLCPPEDPEAMAEVMLRVVKDAELRRRLHQGSLDFAEEWFSWKNATRRTLAALEMAVS